jgi:hypothetical protein
MAHIRKLGFRGEDIRYNQILPVTTDSPFIKPIKKAP